MGITKGHNLELFVQKASTVESSSEHSHEECARAIFPGLCVGYAIHNPHLKKKIEEFILGLKVNHQHNMLVEQLPHSHFPSIFFVEQDAYAKNKSVLEKHPYTQAIGLTTNSWPTEFRSVTQVVGIEYTDAGRMAWGNRVVAQFKDASRTKEIIDSLSIPASEIQSILSVIPKIGFRMRDPQEQERMRREIMQIGGFSLPPYLEPFPLTPPHLAYLILQQDIRDIIRADTEIAKKIIASYSQLSANTKCPYFTRMNNDLTDLLLEQGLNRIVEAVKSDTSFPSVKFRAWLSIIGFAGHQMYLSEYCKRGEFIAHQDIVFAIHESSNDGGKDERYIGKVSAGSNRLRNEVGLLKKSGEILAKIDEAIGKVVENKPGMKQNSHPYLLLPKIERTFFPEKHESSPMGDGIIYLENKGHRVDEVLRGVDEVSVNAVTVEQHFCSVLAKLIPRCTLLGSMVRDSGRIPIVETHWDNYDRNYERYKNAIRDVAIGQTKGINAYSGVSPELSHTRITSPTFQGGLYHILIHPTTLAGLDTLEKYRTQLLAAIDPVIQHISHLPPGLITSRALRNMIIQKPSIYANSRWDPAGIRKVEPWHIRQFDWGLKTSPLLFELAFVVEGTQLASLKRTIPITSWDTGEAGLHYFNETVHQIGMHASPIEYLLAKTATNWESEFMEMQKIISPKDLPTGPEDIKKLLPSNFHDAMTDFTSIILYKNWASVGNFVRYLSSAQSLQNRAHYHWSLDHLFRGIIEVSEYLAYHKPEWQTEMKSMRKITKEIQELYHERRRQE